jgi:flavorubredoxin
MKKAIVIYHTQFGNTEKIAKSLASGMGEQGIEVDCIKVEEVKIEKLTEYDLLAIGSPTLAFSISQPIKSFLEKLERVPIKGKKAYAFDTRMQLWWAGSAGKGIEKRLKRIGMSIVKPYSSAIVKGKEGPLQDGMEEKFKQIGIEIARLI